MIDLSLTVPPSRDHQRQAVGVPNLARDSSDRKRTERALVEAEERLRGALRKRRAGSSCSAQSFLVRRANVAIGRLLDRDVEQLAGRCILDFTHPEDAEPSRDWTKSGP